MARALLLRHGEAGQWARAWLPLPTRLLPKRLRSDRGDPARRAPAQVSAAAARALRRRPRFSEQVGATEAAAPPPPAAAMSDGRREGGAAPVLFPALGFGRRPRPPERGGRVTPAPQPGPWSDA